MASWNRTSARKARNTRTHTRTSLYVQLCISTVVIVACAIALAFLAQRAGASNDPGSSSIEWRVSHLETDMRGAYANTSNLTQHIIALQGRIGDLTERVTQNEDRSNALIVCVRNARGYGMRMRVAHRIEYMMGHRMMSQCVDDWFDAHAQGDH